MTPFIFIIIILHAITGERENISFRSLYRDSCYYMFHILHNTTNNNYLICVYHLSLIPMPHCVDDNNNDIINHDM